MAETQNTGSFNKEKKEDKKVTINTIDRTVLVERLPNVSSLSKYNYMDIIPFGRDNLYPNKVKSIAERSGSIESAVETLSEFLAGEGFGDLNKEIINSEEQTLWDILRDVCFNVSINKGFALHFNYNILGEIIEINQINYEWLRWKKDKEKLISNPDWKRYDKKLSVEYYPFNPENAQEQINEDGIDKYTGQVMYWIPKQKDLYTTANIDSVLDDAQFEAEEKIYRLSNIQNDYSLGGVMKYPSEFEDNKEIEQLKIEVKEAKGSSNAGKIHIIPYSQALSEGKDFKLFEPISRNNIDTLYQNQVNNSKMNIYHKFKQPTILNGISETGMFNQDQYKDAFDFYNAQTETKRKDIERQINKIISASIWAAWGELEIIPKQMKNFQITDNGRDTTNNDNTSSGV